MERSGNWHMLSFLTRRVAAWFAEKQASDAQTAQQKPEQPVSVRLAESLRVIKEETGGSKDVVMREFVIGREPCTAAALVFIDGMINSRLINSDIMKPLLSGFDRANSTCAGKDDLIGYVRKVILTVNEAEEVTTMHRVIGGILSGDAVLLVDGCSKALIINSKGWSNRSVNEPPSEAVVRGPRESFIENLRTNTSLIRRKIKNPALTFEAMVIGRKTRTNIAIAYIRGVAHPELITEIRKRMSAIETDSILESGYIEQFIEDAPGSIFATIGYTEKPDVAAAKLLEGRAAIIVDGTPFVLTAPMLFTESFQSAEDYYFRPFFATMLRIIRAISFSITTLAPALYVAITTFHQELIPTNLLFTMAAAREGIPFPAFVESLIMIITFEILREAGIRLPRPVGQALSIVGALVIGESAVSAGLIGAPMVIVVAITAVSGFVVPTQADAAAVIRMVLLILGATLGGFGVTLGILWFLVHISSLESFGFPYLSPIAPFDVEDSKDTILRAPIWLMLSRPKGMAVDRQRKKFIIPPDKGSQEGGGEI